MLSTTACIITQHSFVWSGLGPDLGRAGLAGLVWSGLVWAGSGLLGRGLGAGWSLLGLDCLLQIDLKANFDMVVGGGYGGPGGGDKARARGRLGLDCLIQIGGGVGRRARRRLGLAGLEGQGAGWWEREG
ncbi:hypothetical protein BY996DRAFT_6614164 [Phakopsora pachyrhizi]|nr:hypothetical protein BY996DRAFT_6614164 [Phakopsora pachyrhizi]